MKSNVRSYCIFCDNDVVNGQKAGAYDKIECPCCGTYNITYTTLSTFVTRSLTEKQKANISGWLFENPGFTIQSENLSWLENLKSPSFHEKADKLLLHLEKNTVFAGQLFDKDISWKSSSWSINEQELDEIIKYLKAAERLGIYARQYKISPKGWAHLEEIKKINQDSQQGFVAMCFNHKMFHMYRRYISKAVSDAGYNPRLVSEGDHNKRIDDEIIAQIKRSKFVVADFTYHRGGVYYEAGFAQGLGLEVIWTCRKDHLNKLHFDVRQYNCLEWEVKKLDEFVKRLTKRIEAVLGRGTYQPESR